MVYVYIIHAHVGMNPLFAFLLPACRTMYYILNCSSYLKYRLKSCFVEIQPILARLHSEYKIRNNWCTLIVAQIIAYTVVIQRRLDTRDETRCPGEVSIYCLASRSRHFSYSQIVFFQELLNFCLTPCQEILTGLFMHQPTVSNCLIMRSVVLRNTLFKKR